MTTTLSTAVHKPPVLSEELINQLQLGNKQAFSELYDAYSPALFYSINRIVKSLVSAEKILQSVFKKIVMNIHTYSPAKASLFTWMSLIVTKEAFDFIRNEKVTSSVQQSSEEDNTIGISSHPDAVPILFDDSRYLAITPQLERVIIELYKRGFSSMEIEQVLCLQVGIAKKK